MLLICSKTFNNAGIHVACAIVTLILLFVVCPAAWSDTYTWTDGDGTVHFTDNPERASTKATRSLPDSADRISYSADIIGRWSNRKKSFDTVIVIFKADQTGEVITSVGLHIPFEWLEQVNGSFEMVLREPPELSVRGKSSKRYTLTAQYNERRDLLIIEDEMKKSQQIMLYPEDDEIQQQKDIRRRNAGRVHAPKHLTFKDATVDDSMTGLTWSRDLNLPGSVRRHRNAQAFINELNRNSYNGVSDWRIPSMKEMKGLIETIISFGQESGRSTVTGQTPLLFSWVGFLNAKVRCYWTSTEGESKGQKYAYSFDDFDQHSLGHEASCGIVPVRKNTDAEKGWQAAVTDDQNAPAIRDNIQEQTFVPKRKVAKKHRTPQNIYRWTDGKSYFYTDDLSSVPERYREGAVLTSASD